ncbi:MAG TPA: 3-hydroxylacyl-ACP dehydratase [Anaeromyxobacter sp.]|nr:3-hydroxylacyl-ACP dehydratase [Anaeromyxobacter sp.]
MTELPPIDELVPHARPMILVDRLLAWTPGRATCEVVLGPDAPFVQDGRVRALVAIEYMAQSVAAYAGMKERQRGEKPSIGLLLGSRDLRLEVSHFTVGERLTVEVEHVFGDERLGSFRCRVLRGSEIVAEASLNVYQAGEELALP